MIDGLAVVADDLTGACDLAGSVRDQGWSATVRIGLSEAGAEAGPEPADCRVIALKSRTAAPERAASDSAEAATRLLTRAGGLLYQKYCSTFDSTEHGNIGPIGDALARVRGNAVSVGTPATPAVGRTQYLGHLFVGGTLLAESSMREHPLTPMRDSLLPRLLRAQTRVPVALVPHDVVRDGAAAVRAAILRHADAGAGHVLVDATNDADLDVLARAIIETDAAADRPVLAAGAAGLATALARVSGPRRAAAGLPKVPDGARLIVAGSASQATRAQLAAFPGPRIEVDPLDLAAGADAVERLSDRLIALLAAAEAPVLVAAASEPHRVAAARSELGAGPAGELIESALARLSAVAVAAGGVTRVLVAGGETSGAVVAGLGVAELAVGPQIEPGLCWTVGRPAGASEPIALLLKSGNFGGTGLFTSAWQSAP